jgi:RHS repeat-associated protein
MLNGHRFTFNGKEADNDVYGSGNSINYDARIYSPRLGQFLTCDPATQKYPFMTPYSAFGDNPIFFKDNGGRTLEPGGNVVKAVSDIRSLVPKEYQSQIQVNSAGKIEFQNYDKLPNAVKSYEGVKLVNDLISSENDYKYSVGSNAVGIERGTGNAYGNNMPSVDDRKGKEAVFNFSKTQRTDIDVNDVANSLPEEDFEGSVTIDDGEFYNQNPETGTGHFDIPRNNIVFHELSENYNRTDKGQDYDVAHKNANASGNKFSQEVNGRPDKDSGRADRFEKKK